MGNRANGKSLLDFYCIGCHKDFRDYEELRVHKEGECNMMENTK